MSEALFAFLLAGGLAAYLGGVRVDGRVPSLCVEGR